MIHPLAIATDGLLTLRGTNTGAIATEGYLSPDAVTLVEDGNRWAGEWLPLPVPKKLEPAQKPARKVKAHARQRGNRASATIRNIRTVHLSVVASASVPLMASAARCDKSAVYEEESIIASLAALL